MPDPGDRIRRPGLHPKIADHPASAPTVSPAPPSDTAPALSRERQVGKFSGDSAKGGECDKSVMFATHEIPVSKVNEFISNKMNEMITFNNFN